MKKLEHPEIEGFYVKELIEEYNSNCEKNDTSSFVRNSHIKLLLEALDAFNEDIFFEMARFPKERSGLNYSLWLDDAGESRTNKHYLPRLKVVDPSDKNNLISVSISRNPEILAGKFKKNENISDVFEFIKKSYDDLMKLWNNEIIGADFIMKYSI